jgi:hypothetical protein
LLDDHLPYLMVCEMNVFKFKHLGIRNSCIQKHIYIYAPEPHHQSREEDRIVVQIDFEEEFVPCTHIHQNHRLVCYLQAEENPYCSENSLHSKPPLMIRHMGHRFSRTKDRCSNSTSEKKTTKDHGKTCYCISCT